ncbi:MAG: penicillin-binding protein 2 [Rickettsiaceae bacterium]|nr:MAG: penicillin-binding protein 2 [Rickettsiaceae bacterium]
MLNKEIIRLQVISRRTFIIIITKLGLLSLLATRMFYLQFIKKDEYKTLSDKNRITTVATIPTRGEIYDTEGIALVLNKNKFRLLFNKSKNQDYQQELIQLCDILKVSQEQQLLITKKCLSADLNTAITIMDQLTWHQISILEENTPYLSSFFIDTVQSRLYYQDSSVSHLLGYVGQVNQEEIKKSAIKNKDYIVGKAGLEKYYEETLCGSIGHKQLEVNAHGRYIREILDVPSIPGNNLHLNIDIELQQKAWSYLNMNGCSAIVIDSSNGNILLCLSAPGFESNNFNKLSSKYWNDLINDPFKPLINKVVQSSYPPGSAFKLITILAALEAGYCATKIINCVAGVSATGNNSFRCWNKHGHGQLDMFGALKHSCNSYMYEISRLIGPERIILMAKKFGFGIKTDIDLPNEVRGLVPSKKWKKSRFKAEWTLGDTFNIAIGQGYLLTTPIQMARFCASIASDGKLYTPHIAKQESSFSQIDIDPSHINILKQAMYQAVNTSGGTAYLSENIRSSFKIAGKTGTAQVQAKLHKNDDLSREGISWKRKNHASFIGFGPYNNPRFAIAVHVDHGGGGGKVAVPIASKIMNDLLSKYN